MRLLSVDTSAAIASVAVFEDDSLIYESTLNNGLTHSENFIPLIESALSFAEFEPGSIDYYACSVGPGSFTGIRIGVETIKSMAHVFDAKCVPVTSIEALSRNITSPIVVPVMDARCNQVYCGIYINREEKLEISALALTELIKILDDIEGTLTFVGDGVKVHKSTILEHFGQRAAFAPENLCLQRASSVGMVALEKIRDGGFVDFRNLNPMYLRKPQAEREYERKHCTI